MKLVVLDYNSGKVFVFDWKDEIEDIGDVYDQLNQEHGTEFSESSCHWMLSDNFEVINR